MKKLLFFLILTFSHFCFAKSAWDYSIRGALRSYPTGASVTGKLGRSFELWNAGGKALYGFVRPSLEVQTSGVVNYGRAQFDIYPISFLGFYGGYSTGSRNLDEMSSFDCSQVICDEKLKRPYYGARLALAYGSVYLVGDHKIENIEVEGRAGLFAEESSSLIGRSGSDTLTTSLAILGYNLSKQWSVGGLFNRSSMKHNKNQSSMLTGFGRYQMNKWSFLFGLGNFHDRTGHDHLSLLGLFEWKGSEGLLLF